MTSDECSYQDEYYKVFWCKDMPKEVVDYIDKPGNLPAQDMNPYWIPYILWYIYPITDDRPLREQDLVDSWLFLQGCVERDHVKFMRIETYPNGNNAYNAMLDSQA
jgi:hypothetical protein